MPSNIEAWSGDFGTEYHERNASDWAGIKNRSRLFGNIFECMEKECKAFPASVIEVGAGVGDNLRAIDMIYDRSKTAVKLMGCEPNAKARAILKDVAAVMPGDLGSLPYADNGADLVFTSGVLIHVPPDDIAKALEEIHRVSKRWILSIEYFNPSPDEVVYRSHQTGMLWRRDWGNAWLSAFPMLKPIGCGFAWKRLYRTRQSDLVAVRKASDLAAVLFLQRNDGRGHRAHHERF